MFFLLITLITTITYVTFLLSHLASPILLPVDFVFLLLARHSLCQHNSALALFVGSAEIEQRLRVGDCKSGIVLLCSRLLAEFSFLISPLLSSPEPYLTQRMPTHKTAFVYMTLYATNAALACILPHGYITPVIKTRLEVCILGYHHLIFVYLS